MILLPTVATTFALTFGFVDSTPKWGPEPGTAAELGAASPTSDGGQRAKKPRRDRRAEKKAQLVRQPSRGRSAEASELSAARDDAPADAPARPRAGLCPENMVMIGRGFCIDQYEAGLLEVLPDGAERPWSPFHTIPSNVRVRAITKAGIYPQGYISGVQAKAACEASGKRLCQPEEWRSACMGPKKTMWTYGPSQVVGKCNDNGRSSMHYFNKGLTDKPEDAWKWGHNGNMLDPRLNQLDGTLSLTGAHPDCTNDYGVYDMVGNLHEWVDDPWGTFQGGYYLDVKLNGDGCYYATTAHDMKHADYSTGFRCCADPNE